jgi:hypothetical protein
MTTISSIGKVAYIYDADSSTWHPVAGLPNTGAAYTWSGEQTFTNDVSFTDVLNAKAGINNFQNPNARDAAITSPIDGIVAFVRQDNTGNSINQIQYYSSTNGWVSYTDTQIITKNANYVLSQHDSGKTISANSSTAISITVPTNASVGFPIGTRIDFIQYGTGQLSFIEASGVTIRSKNSNKKVAAQYSAAGLVKTETNIWVLIGDLTA